MSYAFNHCGLITQDKHLPPMYTSVPESLQYVREANSAPSAKPEATHLQRSPSILLLDRLLFYYLKGDQAVVQGGSGISTIKNRPHNTEKCLTLHQGTCTFLGSLDRPQMRAWPYRRDPEASSWLLTMTAFLPAWRP